MLAKKYNNIPNKLQKTFFTKLIPKMLLLLMLKTAGPNGLIFFEGTHGYPGDNIGSFL